MDLSVFAHRKVLVTGHTGFKGVWLTALLNRLGCEVHGISLPTSSNSPLSNLQPSNLKSETFLDLGDDNGLDIVLAAIQPELVFHLAAQSLVLTSYADPNLTFKSNVMGTSNLLAAAEKNSSIRGIIVVTSDKVYENSETGLPFKESDALGGKDPYSASKAAAELVTRAWENVYKLHKSPIKICAARSGNVIGGGDRAENRLVPDILRSIQSHSDVVLRNPNSVRPWQHVLDALWGYVLIGQKMLSNREVATAYNFGPDSQSIQTVEVVADMFISMSNVKISKKLLPGFFPEATTLLLDSSKAERDLGWKSKLSSIQAIEWTCEFEFPAPNLSYQEILDFQISRYLDGIHV